MAYRFKIEDAQQIFSNNYKNYQQIFPKNKGYCEFNVEKINEDISLYKNSIVSNDDICMVCDEVLADSFFLSVMIKGKAYSKINKKILLNINSNITLASFFPKFTEETTFEKNTQFQSLGFMISKDYIRKSLEKDLKFENFEIFKNKNSSQRVNLLANQIYNCPYIGNLRELYIQSKASELVFLELSDLNKVKKNYDVKFSEYDKNALIKAKEILESQLNCPSINELSKMVKLNDFKLKFGLKKFFNQTAYQISITHRLKQAKFLIQQDELNIAQIAQKIGYKHPSNFTTAFYLHFGILPKDVKRNRFK